MTTSHMVKPKGPHPFDLHVGAKVRLRRRFLGLSQESLARGIGVTFQQVQKYERGTNRISCSKLMEIATLLDVPPAHFFEGFGQTGSVNPENPALEQNIHAFLMTPEGIALAETFPRIRSRTQRRRIVDLVKSLAAEDEGDASVLCATSR
ncbi:helix-turn-helix domain-containing protein [Asticcacaulis tiandongensis]|uniref:helix-turn-helix domain-containing protein n=1 Tax=Asticcacaulis tiandongensis TaxID=2565365 RepID=UPI00112D5ABC|nr:helix-turn-helix transcriptional regulator [Asticcacaulis tiandongensis]